MGGGNQEIDRTGFYLKTPGILLTQVHRDAVSMTGVTASMSTLLCVLIVISRIERAGCVPSTDRGAT